RLLATVDVRRQAVSRGEPTQGCREHHSPRQPPDMRAVRPKLVKVQAQPVDWGYKRGKELIPQRACQADRTGKVALLSPWRAQSVAENATETSRLAVGSLNSLGENLANAREHRLAVRGDDVSLVAG